LDLDPWEGISYSSGRKTPAISRVLEYLKMKIPLLVNQLRINAANLVSKKRTAKTNPLGNPDEKE
jgi:hypothetical protein